MMTITLKSRNGESIYTSEFNSSSTVFHIKRYLKAQMESEYPGIAEEKIRIIFKGKAVSDSISLAALGEETIHLVFDVTLSKEQGGVIMKEIDEPIFHNDIPTRDISMKVSISIKETGEKMVVHPEELVSLNGQVYLVSSRKKMLTMKAVVAFLNNIRVSKEDLARFVIFFLLLLTRNGALVFVLACVFALEVLSKRLSSIYNGYAKDLEHFHRSFYMFFISLFMIDHNRF